MEKELFRESAGPGTGGGGGPAAARLLTKEQVLQHYYGYAEFRPGQAEIIDRLLSRREVLAILPTGAGKSLCFQVPALLLPHLTLVISPLISLMRDQVAHLREAGIPAASVDSGNNEGACGRILYEALQGRYKLLYVSPERLQNKQFLNFVRQVSISMVIVDEAHCVSQWGHDFRPSYRQVPLFLARLPERPIYGAFTATATPRVKSDIIQSLALRNPLVILRSFDRPNLFLETASPADKDRALLDRLETWPEQSGIIYCSTRVHTERVVRLLRERGLAAARYHAGLTSRERERVRSEFVEDKIKIVVATNAFGMGIDKGDVSFVIHYNMPLDLEGYYQEAGRAGRNGKPAHCLLFYSRQDLATNRHLLGLDQGVRLAGTPEEEAARQVRSRLLEGMWQYCHYQGCLRRFLLNYFGEDLAQDCGNCGPCQNKVNFSGILRLGQRLRQVIPRF